MFAYSSRSKCRKIRKICKFRDFPWKFLAKFQGKPTKIVEKSWKLGYFSSYWAYSNRSTGLRMGFSCGLAPCSFGLRILSLAAIICHVRSRKQSRIRGICHFFDVRYFLSVLSGLGWPEKFLVWCNPYFKDHSFPLQVFLVQGDVSF